MKIYCSCCAKQIIHGCPSKSDVNVTTSIGVKSGFSSDSPICGYCAEELDEYGLFPEERIDMEILNYE